MVEMNDLPDEYTRRLSRVMVLPNTLQARQALEALRNKQRLTAARIAAILRSANQARGPLAAVLELRKLRTRHHSR